MARATTAPRHCQKCGARYRPHRDHDPCIKDLPFVMYACCGHGEKFNEGYAALVNGICIRWKRWLPRRVVQRYVMSALMGEKLPRSIEVEKHRHI